MSTFKASQGNTLAAYQSIPSKDADTIYVCKDGFIFLGNSLVAGKGALNYDASLSSYQLQSFDPSMNMVNIDLDSVQLCQYAPSLVELEIDPQYVGQPNWALNMNLDSVFDGEHHIMLHEDGSGLQHTLYFNLTGGNITNLHVYSSTEYLNFGKMMQGHNSIVINQNADPDGMYDITVIKSNAASGRGDAYIKVFCLS